MLLPVGLAFGAGFLDTALGMGSGTLPGPLLVRSYDPALGDALA
jgi:uncharacterized membrane protein YfcA